MLLVGVGGNKSQACGGRFLKDLAQLGQAEVQNPKVALVSDHEVTGLEVAVDNAFLVGSPQSFRQLYSQVQHSVFRERPVLEFLLSVSPLMYSMTKKSRLSWESKSKMVAMCGWFSLERACASRWNTCDGAPQGCSRPDIMGAMT